MRKLLTLFIGRFCDVKRLPTLIHVGNFLLNAARWLSIGLRKQGIRHSGRENTIKTYVTILITYNDSCQPRFLHDTCAPSVNSEIVIDYMFLAK